MVSCKIQQGDGHITAMDWSDVTTPLRSAHHQNRFSPHSRLDRLQSGSIHNIFTTSPELQQLREANTENDEELNGIIEELEQQEEESKQRFISVLNRIASAQCDRLYGAGNTIEVRSRLAINTFPRFSQRDLPDEAGTLEYFMFEWAPYERVAPITAS